MFVPLNWWEILPTYDNQVLKQIQWVGQYAKTTAHEILAYRLCQELGL
jgi:hypothetical protein